MEAFVATRLPIVPNEVREDETTVEFKVVPVRVPAAAVTVSEAPNAIAVPFTVSELLTKLALVMTPFGKKILSETVRYVDEALVIVPLVANILVPVALVKLSSGNVYVPVPISPVFRMKLSSTSISTRLPLGAGDIVGGAEGWGEKAVEELGEGWFVVSDAGVPCPG